MDSTVYTKAYSLPPCNKDEVLRYCGMKPGADTNGLAAVRRILENLLKEVLPKLSCKTCHAAFPVNICGDTVDFGFAKVSSHHLAQHLSGCNSAVIFAATIGMDFDRMLTRKSAVSPSEALVLQAIGAERIESLCDAFEADVGKNVNIIAPRFSPGYGDLPLEFQREIFSVLGCSKRIGVMLGSSFLMSPSKSVTAIIGVGNDG